MWVPIFLSVLSFYFDFLFAIEIRDRLNIVFKTTAFLLPHYLTLKLIILFGLYPLILRPQWKYQIALTVSSLFFLLPNATYAVFFALPIWFVFGMSIFNWVLIIPINLTNKVKFEIKKHSAKIYFLGLLILSSLSVGLLFFDTKGVFDFRHFLLQNDIYEARAQTAQNISSFGKYLMSWTVNLFLPLTMIFAWKHKKLMLIFPILFGILLFGFNPHKTILFNLFIVAMFIFFDGFKTRSRWLMMGFVAFLAIGRVEALLAERHVPLIEGFLVRRLLFLPAYLNQCYVTYFQEPIYLSHSILKSFSSGGVSIDPSVLIGEMAYPGSGAHANNGFFSDGYMNFGILGFWIWIAIAGLLLAVMISAPFRPEMIVFIILALNTLKNSPLLTSLKNHALLAVFAMFILIHFTLANNKTSTKMNELLH